MQWNSYKDLPKLCTLQFISSVSSLGLGFLARFSGYGVVNCPSLLCAAALMSFFWGTAWCLRHPFMKVQLLLGFDNDVIWLVVIWKCRLGSAVFPYLIVSINCVPHAEGRKRGYFPLIIEADSTMYYVLFQATPVYLMLPFSYFMCSNCEALSRVSYQATCCTPNVKARCSGTRKSISWSFLTLDLYERSHVTQAYIRKKLTCCLCSFVVPLLALHLEAYV